MLIKQLLVIVIDTFIIAATTSSIVAIAWYHNCPNQIIMILSFLVMLLTWKYLNFKHCDCEGKIKNEQN